MCYLLINVIQLITSLFENWSDEMLLVVFNLVQFILFSRGMDMIQLRLCIMFLIIRLVKYCVTWLILPVVICLSQRLSHACPSINLLQDETANGSLNQF